MLGYYEILTKTLGETDGDVCRGGRHPTGYSDRHPSGRIPVCRLHRNDGLCAFTWVMLCSLFTTQYPTQIARAFFKLGQIHGHAKISFTLISMGLPESILKIMDSYLQYGKAFKVEGYDF